MIPRRMHTSRRMHRSRRVLCVRMRVEGISVRQRSRRVLGVDVLHVLNRGSVLGRRRVGRLELHARARCVFGVRGDVGRLRFESCLCRLHLRCMGRCVLLW